MIYKWVTSVSLVLGLIHSSVGQCTIGSNDANQLLYVQSPPSKQEPNPATCQSLKNLDVPADLIKIATEIAYNCYKKHESNFNNSKWAAWHRNSFKGKSADGTTNKAGYVLAKDNVIIVGFHGTQSLDNAVTDIAANPTYEKILQAKHTPLTNRNFGVFGGSVGFVHQGFYDAFQSSKDQIIDLIFDYLHEKSGNKTKKSMSQKEKINFISQQKCKLVTTGHSLGAALSVVSGVYFLEKFSLKKGDVYSISLAAPRSFGPSAIVDTYNEKFGEKNHARFYVVNDPVPTVPGPPYVHVGHGIPLPYINYYGANPPSNKNEPQSPHSSAVYKFQIMNNLEHCGSSGSPLVNKAKKLNNIIHNPPHKDTLPSQKPITKKEPDHPKTMLGKGFKKKKLP